MAILRVVCLLQRFVYSACVRQLCVALRAILRGSWCVLAGRVWLAKVPLCCLPFCKIGHLCVVDLAQSLDLDLRRLGPPRVGRWWRDSFVGVFVVLSWLCAFVGRVVAVRAPWWRVVR